MNTQLPYSRRLLEILASFLRLGCTCFGGPVAHIGYFRGEFVTRRQWLSDAVFTDYIALCQFLPGPGSSQLVFAIGMQRAGILGALLASVCFIAPSAILMIAFAYSVAAFGDLEHAGWLHGLKLAAVAVVAQAVWGMGRRLCPDGARLGIALASAIVCLLLPGAVGQIGVIALGALAGYALYRNMPNTNANISHSGLTRGHAWALVSLILFLALLVGLPIAARGNFSLQLFDDFYRTGSLVFGGGHVVLPLLQAALVPPGWINNNDFLAGYGAAQALPGPLFTFAAYLGTVIAPGPHAWVTGLWCLLGIFLPGWLLIGGALPFWHLIRSKMWAQAALFGANAAVVGVLLAALYNPVWKQGVTGVYDFVAVIIALALLEVWKIAPWLVVLLMAAAGQFF
ncbi:MAG: chromate efflux transporter [Chthoniobacterales bacterium]